MTMSQGRFIIPTGICRDHMPMGQRLTTSPIVTSTAPRMAMDAALLPKAGKPPITNRSPIVATDTDDDVISKLKSYLEDVLSSDQMADVETILAGNEVAAPQIAADRRIAQMARDRKSFLQMFPNAGRLKS